MCSSSPNPVLQYLLHPNPTYLSPCRQICGPGLYVCVYILVVCIEKCETLISFFAKKITLT